MRVVVKRDSATSILRKIGVPAKDYGLFIKQLEDKYEVDDTAAKNFLTKRGMEVHDPEKEAKAAAKAAADQAKQAAAQAVADRKAAKAAERAAKAAEAAKPKPPRVSISQVAEELLLAGKANHEVWAVLKEKFKLGDDKKHYPSWFKSRLRRQGKLAKKEKKS